MLRGFERVVRNRQLFKRFAVFSLALSMSTSNVWSLGYFPPARFSNHRGHNAFWSNERENRDSLNKRQIDLVRRTLKELSRVGLKKNARTKCVQDIAQTVLPVGKVKVKGESVLLEENADCCARAKQLDLAEAVSQCSLRVFAEGAKEDRARTLDNLAGLQFQKGDCKQAINSLNEALEIQRRYSSRRASDTGLLLNHLAQCFAQAGSYEESKRLLKQAIKNDTAVRGVASFAVAEDLFNLGVVYQMSGDNTAALESVKTALEKLPNTPGDRDLFEDRTNWSKFRDDLITLLNAEKPGVDSSKPSQSKN